MLFICRALLWHCLVSPCSLKEGIPWPSYGHFLEFCKRPGIQFHARQDEQDATFLRELLHCIAVTLWFWKTVQVAYNFILATIRNMYIPRSIIQGKKSGQDYTRIHCFPYQYCLIYDAVNIWTSLLLQIDQTSSRIHPKLDPVFLCKLT